MIRACGRSWPGVLLVALLTGCTGTPAAEQSKSADIPAPWQSDTASARIDTSLSAATDFLLAAQSPDGAWRSEVYAAFKEGDALTPLVLTARRDARFEPAQLVDRKGH